MILKNVEPGEVLGYFEAISAIPRSPRNEGAITEYILDFAKERGLWAHRDDILNVIVKKPGTAGYENSPPLILQGHTDMVCEKNSGVEHDFTKDPIKLVVDGDTLRADGTTLGADNGIACAMMLAVLDSKDIPHPPLECVFTSQEEIGLIGASKLDFGLLSAKAMINLDSGMERQFTVGCAGGIKATAKLPAQREPMPSGYVCRVLSARGLLGGHSGGDIHLQRGNANKLLARAFMGISARFGTRLVDMHGGAQDNAIPRECFATIALNPGDEANIRAYIAELEAEYRAELRVSDPGVCLALEECTEDCKEVLTANCVDKLLAIVLISPSGVIAMSLDIPGLVETSSNTAVVRTLEEGLLQVQFMVRSSVESRKYFVVERIRLLCKLVGAELDVSAGYPGWQYAPVSRLRDVAVEVYREIHGKDPLVEAKHSGLEGGIFVGGIPGLDCISMGPDLFALHSPDEHLNIPSLERTWILFKKLLSRLA